MHHTIYLDVAAVLQFGKHGPLLSQIDTLVLVAYGSLINLSKKGRSYVRVSIMAGC